MRLANSCLHLGREGSYFFMYFINSMSDIIINKVTIISIISIISPPSVRE